MCGRVFEECGLKSSLKQIRILFILERKLLYRGLRLEWDGIG